MGSQASLLWGLLFASIGIGYFMYGRKQRSGVPLVCGVCMMIYPYFVSNAVLLVLIGVGLMSVPYFFRYY